MGNEGYTNIQFVFVMYICTVSVLLYLGEAYTVKQNDVSSDICMVIVYYSFICVVFYIVHFITLYTV